MAMDPASAFLRGFTMVDQLETNRQLRSFREEEMSRTRKMWKREDDEYERLKLERYRADKLVELDATISDMYANASPDQIKDWDANPLKVFQYAARNMIAKDPEFGEHAALAMGLDPAVGEFIRNRKRPVSGGVIRPVSTGVELGFELDTVNGPQPYTENRSANPRDPVAFRKVGMNELSKIFGAGVMTSNQAIAVTLRRLSGVEDATGPTSSSQHQERSTQRQGTTVESTAEDVTPPNKQGTSYNSYLTPEEQQNLSREEQYRIAEERRQEAVSKAQKGQRDVRATQGMRDLVGDEPATDMAGAVAGELQQPTTNEAIYGVVPGLEKIGAPVDLTDKGQDLADAFTGKSLLGQMWENRSVAWGKLKTAWEWTSNNFRPVQLSDDPAVAPVESKGDMTEKPAANLKSVPDKANFTPDKVAADPAKAASNAKAPASEQATQGMATNVIATPNKRPNIAQLYNAAGLARAGMISTAQLSNYARTGTFDEPTNKQLHSLGNGAFAIFDPKSGSVQFGSVGGKAGSGPASIKNWQDYTNLMQDRTNGIFEENKVGQDQFLSNMDEVYRIFGNPMQTEGQLTAAANSQLTRHIQQGAQFVSRFDPDTTQNVLQGTGDFWPFSDPELRFTPAAIAIGTQAAFDGIDNQHDANEYLNQYAWELSRAMNVSPGALLANVNNLETVVLERQKANPGADRNAIRREVVEEFIRDKLGGK